MAPLACSLLTPAQRPRYAFRGLSHPRQQMRIRRAPFVRIEEVRGLSGIVQSPRQDGVDERIAVELGQAITQRSRLHPNTGRDGSPSYGALR